ncbi:hypothetical protein Y032_0210g2152 [Ancylostoma ceylanicum]|uniref:Uncharacterized protein n=1 Tax=Ancylostoma ceylanicum TaxID=53326 RepID=A0A016SLC5_9BILA|nr:hypothetical protein Y032_0210g2152 [Ancylostoma ceylanicum]
MVTGCYVGALVGDPGREHSPDRELTKQAVTNADCISRVWPQSIFASQFLVRRMNNKQQKKSSCAALNA